MKDNSNSTYLEVAEAAAILEVSSATVRRMFDTGRLRGFRIPGGNHRRITRASVLSLQLASAQTIEPTEARTEA